MANEATLQVQTSLPVNMVVADGAGIEKGTLLKMTDGNVAAASSAEDVFAGIAFNEKIASNGVTSLAVFKSGIFEMYAGGGTAISVGDLVQLSGANIIEGAVVEAEVVAGKVVGKALETVAIGTPERILVEVGRV